MSIQPGARPNVPRSTVLVTGGRGYVGRVLVDGLLAAGVPVRVLDSLLHGTAPGADGPEPAGLEFVRGDVRDPEARDRALAGVGAVVHLAAIVGDPACARNPDEARSVNLHGTHDLVRAAERAGASRFVFASTCSNYGKLESSGHATEEWPLNPVSLYAETKVAAELDVLDRNSDDLATTCLRLATVYGPSPRMRFDLTVNEFTRDVVLGRELVVYGEQFWRPYVHVDDVARAVIAVLGSDPAAVGGEVFNVGDSDENYRKLDLVELLRERIPDAVVRFVQRDEDPRDYRVSFAKIADRLSYTITKRVPDGMDEVALLVGEGTFGDPDAAAYRN